jgi:hypothetical protein
MNGYLSNKLDNFVDDPEKLYRLRRFCRFEVGRRRITGISVEITASKSSGESTSTDG